MWHSPQNGMQEEKVNNVRENEQGERTVNNGEKEYNKSTNLYLNDFINRPSLEDRNVKSL